MIRAYDETYLEQASATLAFAFDYAVHDEGVSLRYFFDTFLSSGFARRFESGDARILAGTSGVELARLVFETDGAKAFAPVRFAEGRSEEYWAGWALARYQWETSLPFSEIDTAVPVERVVSLYHPYHEMDIRQFVDKMNELYRGALPGTRLARRRRAIGLTQRELAGRSGVPLRTVQQYEQRQKLLENASAIAVVKLARALSCDPIDIVDLAG